MTFSDLRDRATGHRAVEVLHEVADDADNLVSDAPRTDSAAYLGQYLAWAETAEIKLANILPGDVISDLVRTPNYWALRASANYTPRLTALIVRETQNRMQELKGQERRCEWSASAGSGILLTLHFWLYPTR